MNPFENVQDNPDRVVVFVQTGERIHGWEVFNGRARYQITGYPGGSAHGRVTVEGEFHRMSKSESSMQIEAGMRRRLAERRELEE
jgi:hypothetical protein